MRIERVRNRDVSKEMEDGRAKKVKARRRIFGDRKGKRVGFYQKRWWESLELWLLPNTDLVFLLLLPERMRLLTLFARR